MIKKIKIIHTVTYLGFAGMENGITNLTNNMDKIK